MYTKPQYTKSAETLVFQPFYTALASDHGSGVAALAAKQRGAELPRGTPSTPRPTPRGPRAALPAWEARADQRNSKMCPRRGNISGAQRVGGASL